MSALVASKIRHAVEPYENPCEKPRVNPFKALCKNLCTKCAAFVGPLVYRVGF